MNTLSLIKKQIEKAAALHDAQIAMTSYRGVKYECQQGAEEVRALAAESVLQSNINTESSARLAGDAGLQSQIDTLSGTQTTDKSALEVSIANETARATAAEAAERCFEKPARQARTGESTP